MLKVATMWARIRQFGEVSLDTPALALDVRAFYSHQGFRSIQVERLAGRDYDSVIMSRSIAPGPRSQDGVVRRATELAASALELEGRRVVEPS